MATGATLTNLLTLYRAECRLSQNPAHNQGDEPAQINHIQRIQQEMYDNFDWPHLKVRRDINVQNGQRYYGLAADIRLERVINLEFLSDGNWRPLRVGIDSGFMSVNNSDLDSRSWPVAAWDLYGGAEGLPEESIEVWPIPNRDANVTSTTMDGVIRVWAIRNLRPLVNPGDVADMDDKCIAMFAAAERLSGTGAKDAQYKLDKANKRLAKLQGQRVKTRIFNMYSTYRQQTPSPRRPIVTYRPPNT